MVIVNVVSNSEDFIVGLLSKWSGEKCFEFFVRGWVGEGVCGGVEGFFRGVV